MEHVPFLRDMNSTQRKGALGSVSIHVLALALALGWFDSTPPPMPGTPANVTTFDIGIPSNGSPTGDEPPPPQAEEEQEDEAPAAVEVEEEEPSERIDPDSSDGEDQSTTPIMNDETSEVEPTKAAPAAAQEGAESSEDTPEAEMTMELPSDENGAGTLAVGASTHGDATGLDPTLSTVIGQAVATRMGACWKPPVGGVPEDSYSRMVVRYDPQGEFLGVFSVIRLVDQFEVEADSLNPYEAAAADALKRCSPLGLPASLYAYWMEVEIQLFGAPPTPQSEE